MAFKQFLLENNLEITVYKRRAARNLKLSIASNGAVRVSIPTWAPYKAGVEFAKSRLSWIESNRTSTALIVDNQAIGKAHRVRFVATDAVRPTVRVGSNEVRVAYPASMETKDPSVQVKAFSGAKKALRLQAEALLPIRLEDLARKHGFEYQSVSIKSLKSRWGSCDQHTNITLNLYLMQLPWHLIDYVLIHELTHTEILKHGPEFWDMMQEHLPNAKALKKELRNYQTTLAA